MNDFRYSTERMHEATSSWLPETRFLPRARHHDEVPEEFLEHMVVCSGCCTAAGEPLLRLVQVKNKDPAVIPRRRLLWSPSYQKTKRSQAHFLHSSSSRSLAQGPAVAGTKKKENGLA
jgi:hypothetical protein